MGKGRIIVDPKIRHGKPIVAGTRVPVQVILGALAGGMTYEEVTQEYNLTRQDTLAALEYAAAVVDAEDVLPLAISDVVPA